MIMLKAMEIVHKEKGKIVGYIYTGTVIENNYNLLRNIREVTDSVIVTISNFERVVATTDKRNSELTIAVSGSPAAGDLKNLKMVKVNQIEYITSSDYIRNGGKESLFVTIGISSVPLEKLKLQFLQKAVVIIILSVIFLSFFVILLNKVTSMPLKKLVDYSDDVESGQFIKGYRKSYIREYNIVGFQMESMVKTIKSTEDRIRQFANATWEAILVHDNGILIEANDQFFSMFGYDIENDKPLLIGTNIIDIIYDKKSTGMAHEINNPLAGIMQSAEVISRRLDRDIYFPANLKAAEKAGTTMEAIKYFMESRNIPEMLNAINKSGKRIAAIVDNMLSFARKTDIRTSSHDLAELIDKTIDLAATDYDLKKQYDFKQIEIRRVYENNMPPVPCEKAKIQQVILNILRNGAQAMQEAMTEKQLFIIRVKFDKMNNMAVIEIEDNGPGVDKDLQKHIFEPFFTTKPMGVGTGLGLSISYFIITDNHNGKMRVESKPGSGTNFILEPPVENIQTDFKMHGESHE